MCAVACSTHSYLVFILSLVSSFRVCVQIRKIETGTSQFQKVLSLLLVLCDLSNHLLSDLLKAFYLFTSMLPSVSGSLNNVI